ncbi:MAG: antitoxin [Acidobacteria bacterium]|nr:MAG: antitoxin [Acidobacteriota bacterium]
MNWKEHITANPAVLVGKPVVKGTRLSVEFILELIAEGWSEADMLRNYPGLTREQILACVAYAKDRLSDEKLLAIPA